MLKYNRYKKGWFWLAEQICYSKIDVVYMTLYLNIKERGNRVFSKIDLVAKKIAVASDTIETIMLIYLLS